MYSDHGHRALCELSDSREVERRSRDLDDVSALLLEGPRGV